MGRKKKKKIDYYIAERIIDIRQNERGVTEYLIKWRDYGEEDNTWVPLENICDPKLFTESGMEVPPGFKPKKVPTRDVIYPPNRNRSSQQNDPNRPGPSGVHVAPPQRAQIQPAEHLLRQRMRQDMTLSDMLTKPLSPLPLQSTEDNFNKIVPPLATTQQDLQVLEPTLPAQLPSMPYSGLPNNLPPPVGTPFPPVEPVPSLMPPEQRPNLIQRVRQPLCIDPKDLKIPYTPVTVHERIFGEIFTTVINTCGMTNLPYTLRDDDPFDSKYPPLRTPLPPISTFLAYKCSNFSSSDAALIRSLIPKLGIPAHPRPPLSPCAPKKLRKSCIPPTQPAKSNLIRPNEATVPNTTARIGDQLDEMPGPSGYHVVPPPISSSASRHRPRTKSDHRAAIQACKRGDASTETMTHPYTMNKGPKLEAATQTSVTTASTCQSHTTGEHQLIVTFSKISTEDTNHQKTDNPQAAEHNGSLFSSTSNDYRQQQRNCTNSGYTPEIDNFNWYPLNFKISEPSTSHIFPTMSE